MSGLAEILLGRGYTVSGSDMSESPLTEKLRSLGAEVFIGQRASNIKNCDLIVYTAAISPDNEEFIAAQASGAVVIDRATLLGSVMKSYKYAVAVAGTHGKTSTTSMMTHIMLAAECDPTVSIGGELASIGGNIRVGKSDYFVCESCEYHGSFLKFFPYISMILNVEADHLDYFRGIDHIIETFRSFALLVPDDGAVVANIDNENVVKTVSGIDRRIITGSVKSPDADYYARNIKDNNGFGEFEICEKGAPLGTIRLSVPGCHNVSNAVCAVAAARYLGLSIKKIAQGLFEYKGVGRRFEIKGERNGALLIDDYAHHPTEISATLATAKNMDCKNIYCVFQPHTYTRTKALFDDFVTALSCGINIIITDIYAAREKDTGIVSSKQLADAIDGAVYIKEFSDCAEYLKEKTQPGDLVITMGAGSVFKIGDMFLE